MQNNYKRTFLKIIIFVIVLAIFARAVVWFTDGGEQAFNKNVVVSLKLEGIILNSDPFIEKLKKYAEDDKVKGIIIRIDSPGGAIGPTQEIFRYINKINKPVYASMGSLAASGGYYVASACDKIYALPSTITGSIGVIMTLSNVQELMDKIGVKSVIIKSGKFKDTGSASRPMTEDERKLLQGTVMELYQQFIDDIKKRRNINADYLAEYADGRVFTGNFALEKGFIDAIGTYDEAFINMKQEHNLGDVELKNIKEKKKLAEEIFGKVSDLLPKSEVKSGFYYLHSTSF